MKIILAAICCLLNGLFANAMEIPIPILNSGKQIGVVRFRPQESPPLFAVRDIVDGLNKIADQSLTEPLEYDAKADKFLSLIELTTEDTEIHFDEALLILTIKVKAAKTIENIVEYGGQEKTSKANVDPAKFSGFLNVYNSASAKPNALNKMSGATKFRLVNNLQSWVQINDAIMNYDNEGFDRERSYLLKDWLNHKLRFHAGEIDSATVGMQTSYSILGLGVGRDFTINSPDYKDHGVSQKLILEKPSQVRVLLNGVQIDSFFSREGPLNLRNLPIINGANEVELETQDNTGRIQRHKFRVLYDSTLLYKGQSDYSLFVGLPKNLNREEIYYDVEWLGSGYYRYGVLNSLSSTIYFSANEKSYFLGTLQNFIVPLGVFSFDFSKIQQDHSRRTGYATKIFYETPHKIYGLNLNFSLRLGAEYAHKYFANNILDESQLSEQLYDWNFSQNLSKTFFNFITSNVGAVQLLNRKDSKEHVYQYYATTSFQFFEKWSFSLGLQHGQTKDNKETSLNVSLRWDDSVAKIGFSHDSRDRSSAVDLSAETANPNRGVDLSTRLERDAEDVSGNVSGRLIHSRFELATIQQVSRPNDSSKWISQANYNFSTALAWSDGTFGISRPINNSFLLVKKANENNLKDDIQINPSLIGDEGVVGDWMPAVISQIGSYNPRNFLLVNKDNTSTARLVPEVIEVPPLFYRGATSIINVNKQALLKGKILRSDNSPWGLKKGNLRMPGGKTAEFFTNRKGQFYIEDTKVGRYIVEVIDGGVPKAIEFNVPEERGEVYDAGSLTLSE